MADGPVLQAALVLYGAAITMALFRLALPRSAVLVSVPAGVVLAVAISVHTVALAWRWREIGHGPFTTMHEILSSNLWSLTLVFAISSCYLREVRSTLWAAAPVLAVLCLWLLVTDARPGHFPPTYGTPLLYMHTLVGKLFLGLLLVAVALGAMPWLRRSRWGERHTEGWADERRFDELAYRFAAFAFVFESLMLIIGAIWAQDAWGRYWAWDPLESWAFVTWIALAATLHARATLRPSPAQHGLWLAAVFALAFLTFFGVPFISVAPHKGAV